MTWNEVKRRVDEYYEANQDECPHCGDIRIEVNRYTTLITLSFEDGCVTVEELP